MHSRSIRGSNFNLPCNRLLWNMSGKYDAITSFLEIASGDLHAKVPKKDEDKSAFWKDTSARYHIHLSHFPEVLYPQLIVKSYMVLPWASLDSFFADFAREVRVLVEPNFEINPKNHEDKLDVAIRELEKIGCKPQLERYKLDLYDYYRQIRIGFVHNLNNEKKLKNLYAKLDIGQIQQFYPSIPAPSPHDKLSYWDFVLFTALVKHISDMLTVSIEKNINWKRYLHHQIAQAKLVLKENRKPENQREEIDCDIPRFFKHGSQRQVVYVKNCIREVYGVYVSDEIIKDSIGSFE